jgi:hypothetical protein
MPQANQQSNMVKPQKVGKHQLSQRDTYAKKMQSAYNNAKKTNTLGKGFGGEPKDKSVTKSTKKMVSTPKKVSATKKTGHPAYSKVEKSVRKTMGY